VIDYKESLFKDLQDLEYAAGYLTAALEEGDDVFLLAVRDVVEAHGGIAPVARASGLNRENLYDMLSRRGNPRLSSLTAILHKLGLDMRFAVRSTANSAA
jgi:probable addiction module antidote protein